MGWVVNVTPRPLYPRERPGVHCIGGWVGPRTGLDECGKSRPHRDSIPGPRGRSATGKNKVKRFNYEGLQVQAHLLRGNINKNANTRRNKTRILITSFKNFKYLETRTNNR